MRLVNKLKDDWTIYEICWLLISTGIILYLSITWEDTLMATISSVAGIISVVLCAKGKISYLYYGIIQCTLYGYIAYTYGLFGESMLNLLFFLPANIITIFLWKKNLKRKDKVVNGEDVVTRKLTKKQWLILIPTIIVSGILYAVLLTEIGAQQVKIDSFAVVLSVVAQFLLTFRYVEQWIFWIIVNVLTVVLWVLVLFESGGNDYGVLVMWIAFLVNSIYGYINWLKISKGAKTNE